VKKNKFWKNLQDSSNPSFMEAYGYLHLF
jgi:hypothetical protein